MTENIGIDQGIYFFNAHHSKALQLLEWKENWFASKISIYAEDKSAQKHKLYPPMHDTWKWFAHFFRHAKVIIIRFNIPNYSNFVW